MKKLASIFLILFCIPTIAQTTWSKRYDLDIGNDYATHVMPLNQGIILQSFGFCDFNSRDCHGLLNIDVDGNIIWKSIIYDTLELNGLRAFIIRDDTILLNANYLGVNDRAYTILSFDLDGNYLHRFDYEQTIPFAARNLNIRPDGGLYASFSIKNPDNNKSVGYTRCYDRNWNLLWDVHTPLTGTLNRWGSAVSLDSGLVMGYTHWPGGGQILTFNIEKYDKYGQLQWHTKYPYECENFDQIIKINPLPDGTYIGAFASDTFGLYAADVEIWFKLDANGNRLWEKVNIYEERLIYHSFINLDGNIIACGEMRDFYFDTIDDPDLSAYIMCLSPDGERLWERKLLNRSSGITYQSLYGGTELPNGDLVFVGEVWDTITSPQNPTYQDMWVIKTDKDGCFSPGCGDWQVLLPSREAAPRPVVQPFFLYPNPAREYAYLAAKLGEQLPSGEYALRLYDATGRFVAAQAFDPTFLTQIDLSRMPSGAFAAVLCRDGVVCQTLKGMKN